MRYCIRLAEGLEYEKRKLSDGTILTMKFKKIGEREEIRKGNKVIIDIVENYTPWTEINKKLWDSLKERDRQKANPEFEYKTKDDPKKTKEGEK